MNTQLIEVIILSYWVDYQLSYLMMVVVQLPNFIALNNFYVVVGLFICVLARINFLRVFRTALQILHTLQSSSLHESSKKPVLTHVHLESFGYITVNDIL